VSEAYEVLTETRPKARQEEEPPPEEDDSPYRIGDFFFIRQLEIDGQPYTSRAKCQISRIDGELFLLVSLATPWRSSSGSVVIALSESLQDPSMSVFQREIVGRSYDEDHRLVLFWISPSADRPVAPPSAMPPKKPADPRFARSTRPWWFRG
jgi:hypothetical protein